MALLFMNVIDNNSRRLTAAGMCVQLRLMLRGLLAPGYFIFSIYVE